MVGKAVIDVAAAHKHFSAACFNQAWDLIDKPDRTEADDRLMVALNQASIFHWMNRPDVSDRNRSVGYWQASRVLALVEQFAAAKWHAEISLRYAAALGPFFRGYAYEALARAAIGAGDLDGAAECLDRARTLAAEIPDAEDRGLLDNDIAALAAAIVEAKRA